MGYKKIHNYVNTSEGGPIRIGTDKYKVLQFIYNSGKEGVRYTDIVKFIVEELRGREYTHAQSGYWGTNLLGSGGWYSGSSSGILRMYCTKKKTMPKILKSGRAKEAYLRYEHVRSRSGIPLHTLSDSELNLAVKYREAKDHYEIHGSKKGNWILVDRKLKMHFGGGDGASKKLEILRAARATIGLPNLNF